MTTVKLTTKVAIECAMSAVKGMTTNFRMTDSDVEFTPDEVYEKLSAMLERVVKRNDAPKAPTTKQKENETYKEDILMLLADGKVRTASEILNEVPNFKDINMSIQRVTAILRIMRNEGKIVRETVKGKSYFKMI